MARDELPFGFLSIIVAITPLLVFIYATTCFFVLAPFAIFISLFCSYKAIANGDKLGYIGLFFAGLLILFFVMYWKFITTFGSFGND